MNKLVIKSNGNIQDVTRQLKKIAAIMGKGATLATVAAMMEKYNQNKKGW